MVPSLELVSSVGWRDGVKLPSVMSSIVWLELHDTFCDALFLKQWIDCPCCSKEACSTTMQTTV